MRELYKVAHLRRGKACEDAYASGDRVTVKGPGPNGVIMDWHRSNRGTPLQWANAVSMQMREAYRRGSRAKARALARALGFRDEYGSDPLQDLVVEVIHLRGGTSAPIDAGYAPGDTVILASGELQTKLSWGTDEDWDPLRAGAALAAHCYHLTDLGRRHRGALIRKALED